MIPSKVEKNVLVNQIKTITITCCKKDKKNKKRPEVKMGPFAGSDKEISEQDHEAPQPVPRRG